MRSATPLIQEVGAPADPNLDVLIYLMHTWFDSDRTSTRHGNTHWEGRVLGKAGQPLHCILQICIGGLSAIAEFLAMFHIQKAKLPEKLPANTMFETLGVWVSYRTLWVE